MSETPTAPKRELRIVDSDTREVIHKVDVTGRSDRSVERVMSGMLLRIREDCHVEDSADDNDEDEEDSEDA